MNKEKMLKRIIADPNIMVGKPVIKGTRLTVEYILGLLAQDGVSYTYAYNGRGDRRQQSVDGGTTNYTLDLKAGLTQVADPAAEALLARSYQPYGEVLSHHGEGAIP